MADAVDPVAPAPAAEPVRAVEPTVVNTPLLAGQSAQQNRQTLTYGLFHQCFWRVLKHFTFYFFWFVLLAFFLKFSVENTIKVVKMASLYQMTVLGPEMLGKLGDLGINVPRGLRTWHTWIRRTAFFGIVLLAVSLVSDDVLRSTVRAITKDGLAAWHLDGTISWVVHNVFMETVVPLMPIALFLAANSRAARHTGIDEGLKRHFETLVYFVDLPCVMSVVSFFLVTAAVITFSDTHEIVLFLGGATALLLFLSNALTICVDTVALRTYYAAGPISLIDTIRIPGTSLFQWFWKKIHR